MFQNCYNMHTLENLEHGDVESGLCSKVVFELMADLEDDDYCVLLTTITPAHILLLLCKTKSKQLWMNEMIRIP